MGEGKLSFLSSGSISTATSIADGRSQTQRAQMPPRPSASPVPVRCSGTSPCAGGAAPLTEHLSGLWEQLLPAAPRPSVCLCSPLPPLSLRSKPGRAAPQHHGTGQLRAELPQPSHLRTPGEAALPSPQKAEKNPLKAGRSVLPPMPLYRSRAAPFDGTATLPRPPPNFSLRSGRTTSAVP